MGVLYQVSENDTGESLQSKLQSAGHTTGKKAGQPVFTKVTAFAFLMFILFYFPCVAVVAAVRKESGKWKWALFMVSYTTVAAWVVALLVNQIGNSM
jgi:ferrous iron transport protein B